MADITISVTVSGMTDGQNIDANDVLVAINEIKTHIENILNGVQVVGRLNLETAEALTIAAGVISPTKTNIAVDTQAAAASDDLDTINNNVDGRLIFLRAANTARTVVVKDGTGNILTSTGDDFSLDDTNKIVLLLGDGTNWHANMVVTPAPVTVQDVLQNQVFS